MAQCVLSVMCVVFVPCAAGHQPVRITVTHRITHETFKAIIDLSLSFGKKKKGKKGGKKVSTGQVFFSVYA